MSATPPREPRTQAAVSSSRYGYRSGTIRRTHAMPQAALQERVNEKICTEKIILPLLRLNQLELVPGSRSSLKAISMKVPAEIWLSRALRLLGTGPRQTDPQSPVALSSLRRTRAVKGPISLWKYRG
jgi:hypothetical protein